MSVWRRSSTHNQRGRLRKDFSRGFSLRDFPRAGWTLWLRKCILFFRMYTWHCTKSLCLATLLVWYASYLVGQRRLVSNNPNHRDQALRLRLHTFIMTSDSCGLTHIKASRFKVNVTRQLLYPTFRIDCFRYVDRTADVQTAAALTASMVATDPISMQSLSSDPRVEGWLEACVAPPFLVDRWLVGGSEGQ